MNYIDNTALRTEMSSWLASQNWDLFSTYTFADRFNFKSARRAIERHYERMKSKLRSNFPFFYIIEPHSTYAASGTHIHGLIGEPVGDLSNSARRMWNDWRERNGHGAADFEKYIEDRGVDYYLTKYLVKSNFDDSYWDIYNLG